MMTAQHKRAADMLGLTLLLGDADAWHGFSLLAATTLTAEERVLMAWSVLRALDPEAVASIATTIIGDIGPPCVPMFNDLVAEADTWVAWASPRERAAYSEALAWYQS
jgi:hypothetical protein